LLDTLENSINLIQTGCSTKREEIIEIFKPKILYWASSYCKRSLDWANDDELSIALTAFNDAIDSYEMEKGSNFSAYAKIVIKHRLIDFFRKEQKHKHMPLEIDTEEFSLVEIRLATENYNREIERQEREQELKIYQQKLSEYGLSFTDLANSSPKHKDTKASLMRASHSLVNEESLVEKFQRTKRLPIKELMLITGLSRKVLETGRKYIIAVSLILLYEEFEYLRDFIEMKDDAF